MGSFDSWSPFSSSAPNNNRQQVRFAIRESTLPRRLAQLSPQAMRSNF